MDMKMSELKKFLGKPINNSRGDTLGRLVGLITNTKNDVISATVELVDGEFVSYPSAQVKLENDSISLIPRWRVECEELKNEMQTVTRRIQALDELYSQGDVQKEIYSELRDQHSHAIEQFKQVQEGLAKELSSKLEDLKREARELESLMANNKMQHSSGEIDDLSYKVSTEAIRSGIERILSERKEIEDYLGYLASLDAKPSKPEPSTIPRSPDVIVVKVKNE